MVEGDGEAGAAPAGPPPSDEGRREARAELDEVEAALDDVAATLARMV